MDWKRIAFLAAGIAAAFGMAGAATEAEVAQRNPLPFRATFLVSLYPAWGKPTDADRDLERKLAATLEEHLRPLLIHPPYHRVSAVCAADQESARQVVVDGRASIVECDPRLFLSAEARASQATAPYTVILQRTGDRPRGAALLTLASARIDSPRKLKNNIIGVLSAGTSYTSAGERLLRAAGLTADRDYWLLRCGYVENAFLHLRTGLVDAVLVSEQMTKEYLQSSPMPGIHTVDSSEACLQPLFAARTEDLDKHSGLIWAAAGALRDCFGPENLVPSQPGFYVSPSRETTAGKRP